MAQCHILEDFNFEQQSCENPRFCTKVVCPFYCSEQCGADLKFQNFHLACILCVFEAAAFDHLN